MPRLSVVVPAYDVESYLATCLQSIARQSLTDLEVVVVDDGSTDGTARIADRFAASDRRFKVISRPNGGLGRARNTGVAAASGDLLCFVDGDDVLADGALDRLTRSLDATGSDFATGNVLRLTRQGTSQARFLARTFARDRPATHLTRCRPLLADRTAWNKLWRRAFWEEQDLRFPEDVVHEDIPVTLPAHLAARSVDVLSAPVYHWRLREDGALSITQRRLEPAVLRDRLAAIASVRAHFAEHAPRKVRRWYDASLLADDLRLHLNLLDQADPAYCALFVEEVGRLFDGAPPSLLDGLPAIDRLKWHLVLRGHLPELLEVLRFERERGPETPVLRAGTRHYGDFPFRDDARLGIPRSASRLGRRDEDLALSAHLTAVVAEPGRLRLRGHAHVSGLPADAPGRQRTVIGAIAPGRFERLRVRLRPARLDTAVAPRDRADGAGGLDVSWSGFEAVLDLEDLRRGGRWADGTWKLFAETRAGFVRRRRAVFALESADLVGTVDLVAGDGALIRASVSLAGAVTVRVETRWVRARALPALDDGAPILTCAVAGVPDGAAELELRRRSDALVVRRPAAIADAALAVELPLAELHGAPASLEARAAGTAGAGEMWDLRLCTATARLAVALPAELDATAWRSPGRETVCVRGRRGDAELVTRVVPVAAPAAPLPAPRAGSRISAEGAP